MTALNHTLESELVVICADTLRTNPSKQPNGFASKVLPLPHLHGGVVCGRGSLDLLLSWYVFIQRGGDRDRHAPVRPSDHWPTAEALAGSLRRRARDFVDLPLRARRFGWATPWVAVFSET